ncbi:MAG: NAD(P)H-dependent oxidoreductase [Candidatus Bathyarchaeota archaeon]|nr:NAD(P)H-dependent oxidoreductase [Candidatus Bathyarchaeota archaeon]
MNIVVINGARPQDSKVDETSDILQSVLSQLGDVTAYKMRDMEIADCMGCFACWLKTPGQCIINDAGKEITPKIIKSDLRIFVTPVVFGGYSYELKKILDREGLSELLPFLAEFNGEIHHPPRYDKCSRIITVGVLPKPNPEYERIFKTLAGRIALNAHAPAYAVAVIYNDDSPEKIRETIKGLIAEAGVN